jgi:hypothetical protein
MTDTKNYLGQGKEERLEMAYRKFCCENKYHPYDKNDKSFFTTGDKKDIPHSMAWRGLHEEDVSGYSWEGEEDEVEVEEWEGENLMLATYDYDNDYPCIIFTEEGEQVGFFPPGKWSMNNYDKKKAHFFEYGVYRDEGEKPWEEPHWFGRATWENFECKEEIDKYYKDLAKNM